MFSGVLSRVLSRGVLPGCSQGCSQGCSTGWYPGCSQGCSTGCYPGCSQVCSIGYYPGCSQRCSTGCSQGCPLKRILPFYYDYKCDLTFCELLLKWRSSKTEKSWLFIKRKVYRDITTYLKQLLELASENPMGVNPTTKISCLFHTRVHTVPKVIDFHKM